MEDMQIITLFLARNEDAIRHTDDTYGRRLYHLVDGILRSGQDAEESVSDTYLQAWNSIPPERPGILYAFLAAICRHLSLNRLDWRSAAKRSGCMVELTAELESCIPSRTSDPVTRIAVKDALEQFLRGLKQEERLLFLRRYLYLEPIAQLAQEFGISQSKCKTLLYRLRNKLRLYLEKEGITV